MRKIYLFILLVRTAPFIAAQPARSPLLVPYTNVVAYGRQYTDVFSGMANQASLANVKKAGAGVYGEKRFLLRELSNYAAVLVWPTRLGGFGLTLGYNGAANFNTGQVGLAYGKKLGDKIDAGIQFNYRTITLAGYGSSSTVTIEAGTLWHLTDKMHLGVHVYNPVGGRFGQANKEKIASVYSSGIGYEASDKLFLWVQVSKQEDQPLAIHAGMQYVFADHFFSRLGIAATTGNYFFGAGVKWKTCRLDIVSSWQAYLGFTPAVMLLFDFNGDDKGQSHEN